MNKTYLFFLIFVISGCANYRLTSSSNPFEQYGIKSLHIPMFYNHSALPNVSNVFTTKIMNTLTGFKGLKLGESEVNSDAVLIGIISSSRPLNKVIQPKGERSVKNTYKDSLSDEREDFYLPTSAEIKVELRIIVIKKPSKAEIKFLQTKYGQHSVSNKIVFNELISTNASFLLKELDSKGYSVLGTQNRGARKLAISGLADQAAGNFKDMILYAF